MHKVMYKVEKLSSWMVSIVKRIFNAFLSETQI